MLTKSLGSRPLTRAILGAVLTTALGAFGTAAAAHAEPLPDGSYATPADGASRPASSWPDATNFEMFEFTLYSDFPPGAEDDLEVATGSALDADGAPADAARVDAYVVPRRAGFSDIFSARTNVASRWLATPGTYYWQASYREPDEPDEPPYTSPVQRITITPHRDPDRPDPPRLPPPALSALLPPAPPPLPSVKVAARLTLSAARRTGRAMIRHETRPRALRSACARETDFIVTSRLSWRDGRYAYRGTLGVRSTPAGLHAAFRGSRTQRSCHRRCRRTLRW